jgi:peptide/nickel transport system permease protein
VSRYIIKRVLLSIIVLFIVILITFVITRLIPGDPAIKWAGPKANAAQIEAAREELGLDNPYIIQFGDYVADIFHGDLGYSYITHRSVTDELVEAIPATMELIILSTIVSILLGVTLGLYSAKYKDRLLDHGVRIVSIGAVSLPSFWFALALQLIFYGILGIFPLGGRLGTEVSLVYEVPHITGMMLLDAILVGNWVIFKDALWHLVLPVLTLSTNMGVVARMTRSALLEILNEDYIVAARSYGIRERNILWIYALKNSLGPTTTVVTLTVGYTIVNTFLVESIFSWPGIGKYVSNAVMSFDYPAIMGVTIFSAIVYLLLNLIADIIISLDPRVRI